MSKITFAFIGTLLVGLAAIAGSYAEVYSLPRAYQQTIILGWVAIAVSGFSFVIGQRQGRPPGFEQKIGFQFYENRSALPTKSLAEELRGANIVWAAWTTGNKETDSNIFEQLPIKQLILKNPDSLQPTHSTLKLKDLIPQAVESIKKVTKNAKDESVPVYHHQGPINSVIIANPESSKKDGWARLEFSSPYIESTKRPSIRISQQAYPELFDTLVAMYKDMIKESERK